jgi:hypothetical protein
MNHLRLVMLFIACPALAAAANVQEWALPAPPGSAQPHLSVAPDGDLLLSWIERVEAGGHRLAFARQQAPASGWSPPQVIAQGTDWFVNWADFPALQALPDGSLWAHTLVRNGAAPYAYDVHLHVADDGRSWRALGPVHDDRTQTEHGFASLWPQGRDGLGIAWLDGRHTGGGHVDHEGHDAHHGSGAMTVRAASFGADGAKRHEAELDGMTCDCCQTDSAVSDDGALVAYRGRSAGEVRDILVTRFTGEAWTPPVTVHADQWVIAGCPVNGPAIAARGRQAWVAWFTGAGEQPSVRLAGSGDAAGSFGPMREVATGEGQLGRVDLAADASGVWLSWMEEADGVQSVWLARFDADLATESFRRKVADVKGRGRATGFPRLQLQAGAAWLAWTEVEAGQPRLRGAVVRP